MWAKFRGLGFRVFSLEGLGIWGFRVHGLIGLGLRWGWGGCESLGDRVSGSLWM